jgi:hypothetical protein
MHETPGAPQRWLVVCLLAVAPWAARAQAHPVDTTLRDFRSARSYGMGGAYRALAYSADVVSGNPAAMSLYQRYQTELAGAWEIDGRLAFGSLEIVDSNSNRIAAGLSYHFASIGRGGATRLVNLETLAMAIPVANWLHFGMAARHLFMFGADRGNAITGDAGLAFRFGENVNLAIGAHNVIDTHHPELATYYSASAALIFGMAALAADVTADFGAAREGGDPAIDPGLTPILSVSAGAEYIVGVVPLRAGFHYDGITGGRYVSVGVGLMTETGNIDLAYRHELNGSGRLISIGVRLGP